MQPSQKFLLLACFVVFISCTSISSENDITIDAIIAKGVTPTLLGDQFQYTEGPLWIAEKGILIFSDVPANKMYQWDEKNGITNVRLIYRKILTKVDFYVIIFL